MLDLVGPVGRVEGHHHGPQPLPAQVGEDPVGRVGRVEPDPVALADAEPGQAARDAGAALAQLGARQPRDGAGLGRQQRLRQAALAQAPPHILDR